MKKLLLIIFTILNVFTANSQVFINEVFATNASTNLDSKYYNYSGWVELYNNGSTNVELGNYYFSDDINNKFKWKLPSGAIQSKQFAIFWFNEENNGIYTSFKLEAKGSKIFLFNNNGNIVDSVKYPKQYPNISYSRYPDGANGWQYCSEPTFRNRNSDKRYSIFTSVPVFSIKGGLFSNPFMLSVTTDNPGAEIRYTLDGSTPNKQSNLYLSQINIKNTTIVRAKVFETGHLPSEIITQSYIFPDHDINMPIFSITTDSLNLWDELMGIYVAGTNGIAGYCSNEPKNYNQDWERAVNIEYFDTLGIQQINQYSGIKIAGNCSRGFPQKSFSLNPRNLYGKGKLKYPFFSSKNITDFDRLFLRNSGNDWSNAFLRDALFNVLVKDKMDIDYIAYEPSVVYLNGNYWGLLDTREKIDEHYIMSNYMLEENAFDMLENDRMVINGSADNYNALLSFITSNDLTNSTNYENVKSKMDVNEYINYMVTQIYIANTDWPGNNVKFWRSKLGGGKWRWILMDLDFGYGVYDPNINHNTLQFAMEPNGPGWPNPPWSTFLFRRLITNASFKEDFIKRFACYLNTVFEPKRVVGVIDSLRNNIKPEIYYHNQKWQGIWDWEGNIQFLRTYAQLRPSYVRQHIVSTFGLSGTCQLTIKADNPDAGTIFVDNIPFYDDSFTGTYFKDFSVNLNPVAKPGYKFLGWYKQNYNTDSINFVNKDDTWKYFDYGYLPASDWNSSVFNDAVWKSGNAQFGYGDGDENTIVGYGSDQSNKYITTYFRKNFTVSNALMYNGLKLRLLIDDGAVIYINNNEVLRYHMPSGNISYSTLANYGVAGNDENAYFEFEIPASVLLEGNNIIAVEVHQSSPGSSDISFNMELKAAKIQYLKEESIPGQNIDFKSSGNTELLAKFQYLGNLPAIYINEYLADNQTGITDENGDHVPWIELYNSSPGSFDIAGLYISNDVNNLCLWQIPSGDAEKTTIGFREFLILWADGQTNEGVLHLPFQLNSAGGKLFLTHVAGSDTTILDSLTYPSQIQDVAHGRYKDGTLDTYYLSSPSPLALNSEPNQLPVFSSLPVLSAHAEDNYSYNISATDKNNDVLTFSYKNLPSWLIFNDNGNGTASLTGTPQTENKGENPVLISVSDGKSFLPTEQIFSILVQGPLVFESSNFGKWKFYPNPVKDYIQIIPESNVHEYAIRLSNLSGKLIFEKLKISGNYQLNLSGLPKGMYFLITKVNENTFITKLMKSE